MSTKGKITALKKGTATITAKVGKKKYNCKVPNGYNILNGGEENPTYLTVKNVFQFDVSGNLINHYDSLRQCAKALGLKGTGWLTKCINEKS